MESFIELSNEELLSIDAGEYVNLYEEGYEAGEVAGKIIGGVLMLYGGWSAIRVLL